MADHQAGHPQIVCAIFYEQDVICLRAGCGHATYLGLDGRVYYENYGEGSGPKVLTDPRAVASAIVKCAADIGMPELLDQLSTPPTGAVVCRLCEGSRWETPEPTGCLDGRAWCCRRCHGLGWTLG